MDLKQFKTVEQLAAAIRTLIISTSSISSTTYNVKHYGATGDGATNDSAAIQACIDAAPDDSIIYFPDGDYKITTSLQVYGRDHLVFTGPGVIKPAGVIGWDVEDTAGSSCEENKWDGLKMVGDSGYAAVSFESKNATGVRHNFVIDCDFIEFKYGVRTVSGGTNQRKIIVRDNRFTVTDVANSVGVLIESDDSEVKANIIRGYETGIQIDGKSNVVLGNHIFKSPSASTDVDIAVGRGLATTDACAGLLISENYLDGQPADGYIVLDVRSARGISIIGNTFRAESTGGPFILFEVDSGNWNVQDITITGNIFRCADGTLDPSITFLTDATPSSVDTDESEHFHMRWNTWKSAAPYCTGDEIRQVGTFADPYVSNPMLGRLLELTLTADVTISDPANPVTGGIGNQLTYLFIQDGTGGWDVTWNGVFKNGWVDTGNTAGLRSTITFEWDGTNWNQVGGQSPYA